MGKIGLALEGTPYKASTLELSATEEICSVNLTALDCFTFFESTLDFARMLKKGGRTPADLLKEITFTRYRSGTIGDYSTRLHYMTDWLEDNQSKHVVRLLSELPGSEKLTSKVDYMSHHPNGSIQMKANPSLIEKIKLREAKINERTVKYVPLDKIADAEPFLKTGDIVAICTNIAGLDVQHTGLVLRDKDNVPHFMDASSRKVNMKVTVEAGPISEAIKRSDTAIGAIFARPLEPNNSAR
jgi:hypothetical protein